MMGAKRVGADGKPHSLDGKPHSLDIGPVTCSDGVERFVPRVIWGMIFRFLIFEDGYHDACPAQNVHA